MAVLAILTLVFVTDFTASYLAGRYLDARQDRKVWDTVRWDMWLAFVVGVNVLGFVEVKWWALPVSVVGSGLGTWWSFR